MFILFDGLPETAPGYLNLDRSARIYARQKFPNGVPKINPFLTPHFTQSMIDDLHWRSGFSWSYGGWMEDRSFVWRGSYLEQSGAFIHLGVDFNVPAGTPVLFSRHGTVIHVGNDHPLEGGWGPHVIVRLRSEPFVLIYGHLDPRFLPSVGDELTPGMIFAKVGIDTENGGWFSHLHLQAIPEKLYFSVYADRIDDLDGYGKKEELLALTRNFPNPLRFATFPVLKK